METHVFALIILISIILRDSASSNAPGDHDIRQLLRAKRTILFPDPLKSETKIQVLFGLGLPMEEDISVILSYVLKCDYDLPYNSSDFNDGLDARSLVSRWTIYRMLRMAISSRGAPGKACLLRTICEAAENSFYLDGRQSLLAEILHLLLTPSTTSEEYEIYSDREYRAAEAIGQYSLGEACRLTYRECVHSPLDYITRISDILAT